MRGSNPCGSPIRTGWIKLWRNVGGTNAPFFFLLCPQQGGEGHCLLSTLAPKDRVHSHLISSYRLQCWKECWKGVIWVVLTVLKQLPSILGLEKKKALQCQLTDQVQLSAWTDPGICCKSWPVELPNLYQRQSLGFSCRKSWLRKVEACGFEIFSATVSDILTFRYDFYYGVTMRYTFYLYHCSITIYIFFLFLGSS